MFWGLIMEPQKRYTQTVKKAFHVSMAALDISNCDKEPTQVLCSSDNRNYLLCTLQKDTVFQCPLELTFEAGDKISFAANGNSHVHLTGYLTDLDDLDEEEDEDADEVADEEEELITSKKRGLKDLEGPAGKKLKTAELLDAIAFQSDDSDDDSFSATLNGLEEDDSDNDEEEEDDDEDEEDEDDSEGEEEESEADESGDGEEDEEGASDGSPKVVAKKQKLLNGTGTPAKQNTSAQVKTPNKKAENTNKTPKQENVKSPKDKQQQQKTPNTPKEQPKKRTLEGGIIAEDLKLGTGQVAKPGKLCKVYYEGRLKGANKAFDTARSEPGFKFRLGKQEVIKAWDVGINGMKVGGKRRLTCPPAMAYGKKGAPPKIPGNSTLVFDVELKGIM